ncbi:HEAT repeat domain-containing protein [bacterium]|nr:HEAT repeat domain-containing protein [bacterium]
MNINLQNILYPYGSLNFYFLLLIMVTGFLLLFSFVFTIYTIVLRITNYYNERRRQQMEEIWRPLILSAISEDRKRLFPSKNIKSKDESFFVEYIMRYAWVLRGEERDAVNKLAYPFLDKFAEKYNKADPETRAYVIRILSVIRFEKYIDRIIAALDDTSPLVVMVAAHALAKKEHPQYIGAILNKLERFETWSLNYIASMIATAGSDVAPELRRTYANKSLSLRVRSIAAETLWMIKDYAAADIAASLLESGYDRDLAVTSLRLIKAFGHPRHLPQVRELCKIDDFVIRAQAFAALGAIGERPDIDLMLKALNDDSAWVVLHAARGLVSTKYKSRLLEIAFSEHKHAEVAREVLQEADL